MSRLISITNNLKLWELQYLKTAKESDGQNTDIMPSDLNQEKKPNHNYIKSISWELQYLTTVKE